MCPQPQGWPPRPSASARLGGTQDSDLLRALCLSSEPAGRWGAAPWDSPQLEASQGTLGGDTKPCRRSRGPPAAGAGCAQGAAGRWHPWHHTHCPGRCGGRPTAPLPGQLRRWGRAHTPWLHYSLALLRINHHAIALYFQFTCIFLVEPQTCLAVCGSPHRLCPASGRRLPAAKAPPLHLGRAAAAMLPAMLMPRAMPCSHQPDRARRLRNQGFWGRAKPGHFTAPSCAQNHHPATAGLH